MVDKFKESSYVDQSIVKHKSIMEIKTDNQWVKYMTNVLNGLEPEPIEIPSNVTKAERNAVKELKENRKIIIKKADKVNVFVVMDVNFYRDKLVLSDHLSTNTYQNRFAINF